MQLEVTSPEKPSLTTLPTICVNLLPVKCKTEGGYWVALFISWATVPTIYAQGRVGFLQALLFLINTEDGRSSQIEE